MYETSRPAARKTKQFSGNLGNFLLKRCHRSWYLEEWGERTGDFIQCRHHGMWPQRVPSSRRFETLNGSGFSFKQMLWTVRCSDYSIILSPKKSEPTVTAGRRRCWFVWNGCDKSSVPILSFKIRKWSGSPETGSEDHHQCRLWLQTAMICHCWSVAWADSDSCTLQKTTSSSLIPPIPSTLSQGGAFFHLSLHCCGHFSSKYQWKVLTLKHGHDLLPLRLVTSIRSFEFVAFQFFYG